MSRQFLFHGMWCSKNWSLNQIGKAENKKGGVGVRGEGGWIQPSKHLKSHGSESWEQDLIWAWRGSSYVLTLLMNNQDKSWKVQEWHFFYVLFYFMCYKTILGNIQINSSIIVIKHFLRCLTKQNKKKTNTTEQSCRSCKEITWQHFSVQLFSEELNC